MIGLEGRRRDLAQTLATLTKEAERLQFARRVPLSADSEERAVELEFDPAIDAREAQVCREARSVADAIQRIDDETYGICARCGGTIPTARLDAVPEALLCLACAQSSAGTSKGKCG